MPMIGNINNAGLKGLSPQTPNAFSPAAGPQTSGLIAEIAALRAELAALKAEVQNFCVHQQQSGAVVFPASPNRVTMGVGNATVTFDAHGCSIAGNMVAITAAGTLQLSAAALNTTASISQFHMLKCDTIMATTVIGASYTPGAGNIM